MISIYLSLEYSISQRDRKGGYADILQFGIMKLISYIVR